MDGMSILIIVAIAAVLVMVVSFAVLRADAGRLRRERNRYDASEIEHRPDPGLQPAPPLLDHEPSIVIGNGVESGRLPTRQPQPLQRPDPRIVFGSLQSTGHVQPSNPVSETGGIRFGTASAVQVTRKCPICGNEINAGVAVMECAKCHTRFHRAPCWEQHNREGKQGCPQCNDAHVVSLTA